ncbi:PKD domain-containing protein [Candidatus Bipolaricaulota bacterium]|nr:PKD domain-containing protein [Candidatus Bipolaricaulota bacterium]
MHRIAVVAIALSLLISMASYAQESDYPVVPPADEHYSSAERALLTHAIEQLAETLRQSEFACGKYSPAEWSSRQFAAYAQGILSRMGYVSVLVGTEENDEEHVWLLVSILLGSGGEVAWIPVEATPDSGRPQTSLGRIPMSINAFGLAVYESPYQQFSERIELPPNMPPLPVIRPIPSRGVLGSKVRFLGTQSRDSDGEIILWFWSFGDGGTSTDHSPEHLYVAKGTYEVSLTVIDSRGESRAVTQSFAVGDPHDEPSGYDCPSCG